MDDSAELFEAIAHPTRIKILKILEKAPSTFASLKRQLNIESSGNLDHHIKKLGSLVTVQVDGRYTLTDAGKKALLSVSAVEKWKESERLRLKTFVERPRVVTFLAALTLVATVAAALIVGQVAYGDSLNVPFLPIAYLAATILGLLSLVGLLIGRSWGWTFAVLQAALVLIYSLVPLYFDLYAENILIVKSTENPGSFVWVAVIFLMLTELFVLLNAIRKPVREFFGKQNITPLRHRALIASILAIYSGLFELYMGCLAYFTTPSSVGSGTAGTFNLFFLVTGFFVAMGGVMVSLRKYALGGILILVFSLFPIPYYSVAATFSSGVRFLVFPIDLVVTAMLVAIPYVAATLAFTSRSKEKGDLLG